MKSLTTKLLSAFACVVLSLSFFHGQTSGQREAAPAAGTLVLSHAEYLDRVQAVWTAQMIAQRTGGRFEHKPASTLPITPLSHLPGYAPVDDDYYYEMVAIRAFEKYGIGLTVQQLGQQWLENNAGSWGPSEQALLLLKRGVKPPDTGHPRYNKLWWTIGSQFSSDVYGVLNPGMPNAAAEMSRRLGHINGYAEGTDGAVFVAGMISIAFVEKDTHAIVVAHWATDDGGALRIPIQIPETQAAELFSLADLMQYWNPDWKLERAGFGGAGGGMRGIRGITYLDGDVLSTYPRDEVRGTVLTRSARLGKDAALTFEAGVDPGRSWQLQVYVNDDKVLDKLIDGGSETRVWKDIEVNLAKYANQEVVLRLYQRVLIPQHEAGNAYWRNLVVH